MKVETFTRACSPETSGIHPGLDITGISTLEAAGPGDAALLTTSKWIQTAASSQAGLLLVSKSLEADVREKLPDRPMAIMDNPWVGAKWLLENLYPDQTHPWPGVHPSAVVHESAKLGWGVVVGPLSVIGPDAVVGDDSKIGPHCSVGTGCQIGDSCSLHSGVVLESGTRLGNRVIIHAGSVLGADGFKYEVINGHREKIPQVGVVVVEDDVEIGANTCIDRASFTETRIGKNTKIDNLVQIGHNVRIGKDGIVVAQVGIAGSCEIGDSVILAGQVGLTEHLKIGKGAIALARAAIMNDVEPGTVVMGEPARPHRQNLRILAAREKLPDALVEVRKLREDLKKALDRIEQLEAGGGISPKTS